MSPDASLQTIPDALRAAAEHFPERPAYIEGVGASTRTLAWREVSRRVDEVAAGLVALGLQPGDRVAFCGENSVDWIIAYFATVAAGGCGVLVYYELKASEIREQVMRPASRFLCASESVLSKLPPDLGVEAVILLGGAKSPASEGCLTLDSVAAAATTESRAILPSRAPTPSDLAAIVYTSGTTGGAKGVMLSQGNFLSNAHSALAVLGLSEEDSVLLVLPLHHAMPFIATLVLVPLLGASLVLENDLRRIRDRLQAQRPTVFFGVPALYELMYRNILARAESEGRLKTFLKVQGIVRKVKQLTGVNLGPLLFRPVHAALGGRLKLLVSGGAALSPSTALDFFSLGLPLLQGWGMTEASPAVALQSFSKSRFLYTKHYEEHVGSVGQAVPGVEVRLIDVPEKGIRVAEAGEGEVILRGSNVFQGYWQAEEQTRAAMPDGWLHTGDLGRLDRDGNIYLTGRSKYIIVLDSGEKVHPDELEAKLSESVVIADVCVLGREMRGKPTVTAIVYPDVEALQALSQTEGKATDATTVRRIVASEVERLGKEVAAYKRVGRIELSDKPLPKTALRKVARGQLQDDYAFNYETWLASGEASSV